MLRSHRCFNLYSRSGAPWIWFSVQSAPIADQACTVSTAATAAEQAQLPSANCSSWTAEAPRWQQPQPHDGWIKQQPTHWIQQQQKRPLQERQQQQQQHEQPLRLMQHPLPTTQGSPDLVQARSTPLPNGFQAAADAEGSRTARHPLSCQPLATPHHTCLPTILVSSRHMPLHAAAHHSCDVTLARQQWQQWQQRRALLGVAKPKKNYQDHHQKKPKKYKLKTPPIARRRVVVGADGVMWRMQAGRRHKRYKKSSARLNNLKGMVPLHKAHATKLRKLGFKKKWWYHIKA